MGKAYPPPLEYDLYLPFSISTPVGFGVGVGVGSGVGLGFGIGFGFGFNVDSGVGFWVSATSCASIAICR